MNSSQRFYELGFKLLSNSQRFNTANYFRSLYQAKKRESQYQSPKNSSKITFNTVKKTRQEPYQDYFVINSNKKFRLKLDNIYEKPSMPKLNEEFIKLAQKLRINKDRQRELYIRAVSLENEKIAHRIYNQKPVAINVKQLEKLNAETHDKYLQIIKSPLIMRKLILSNPVNLPKIFTPKKPKNNNAHSKTEFNLENENDDSFNNAVEHSNKDITHQKRGHL